MPWPQRLVLAAAFGVAGTLVVACGSEARAPTPRPTHRAPITALPPPTSGPAPTSSSESGGGPALAGVSMTPQTIVVQSTCSARCVQITFQLTISGQPPPGASFAVDANIPAEAQHLFVLCRSGGQPPCAGGGTVYTLQLVNVPAQGTTTYRFQEADPTGGVTVFEQGPLDLVATAQVGAVYPPAPSPSP